MLGGAGPGGRDERPPYLYSTGTVGPSVKCVPRIPAVLVWGSWVGVRAVCGVEGGWWGADGRPDAGGGESRR